MGYEEFLSEGAYWERDYDDKVLQAVDYEDIHKILHIKDYYFRGIARG